MNKIGRLLHLESLLVEADANGKFSFSWRGICPISVFYPVVGISCIRNPLGAPHTGHTSGEHNLYHEFDSYFAFFFLEAKTLK